MSYVAIFAAHFYYLIWFFLDPGDIVQAGDVAHSHSLKAPTKLSLCFKPSRNSWLDWDIFWTSCFDLAAAMHLFPDCKMHNHPCSLLHVHCLCTVTKRFLSEILHLYPVSAYFAFIEFLDFTMHRFPLCLRTSPSNWWSIFHDWATTPSLVRAFHSLICAITPKTIYFTQKT